MPTIRWLDRLGRRPGAGVRPPRWRVPAGRLRPAAAPASHEFEAPAIRGLLDAAAARLRLLEVAFNLPMAAALLVGALAVAVPLMRLELAPLAGVALALGLALAGWRLYPALQRPDVVTVARRLDRANALDDLLSSAITVGDSTAGLVAEVRRRAIARAPQISPRSIGGPRLDRNGLAGLGMALALLGLLAAVAIERRDAPIQSTAPDPASGAPAASTPHVDALRAARAELARALDPNAPARAAGMDELARALADEPATRSAGRALAGGDAAGAAAELSELGQRLSRMQPEERASLQAALESMLPEAADDPLLTGPLQDAAQALAEHRLASAAQALEEFGQALQASRSQLANQAELRARMEQLGDELGGAGADPDGDAAPTPGSPSGTAGPVSAPVGSAPVGSVERIRTDGTIEIVPLEPGSEPAALQPRPLELGIDSEPGRNPSAGLLGFAHPAPAPQTPRGLFDDRLLRSYVAGPVDE